MPRPLRIKSRPTRPEFKESSRITFTDDEIKEAWLAVHNLTRMLPQLQHFARSLTGNPRIIVRVSHETPSVSGNVITIRPPIGLGKNPPHQRSLCGDRDENYQQQCPACKLREVIEFYLFHEIGHVIKGSEDPVESSAKDAFISYMNEWHPGSACSHETEIRAKLPSAPDAMDYASACNRYVAMIINALEDARVNEGVYSLVPGMRLVFDLNIEKILNEGVDLGIGSDTASWKKAPLDAQFMVGLFLLASRHEVEGHLDPSVVEALRNNDIVSICIQAGVAPDSSRIFVLGIEAFRVAQGLGFCLVPKCEPLPPAPPSNDDSGRGEPQSGNGQAESEESNSGESGESDQSGTEGSAVSGENAQRGDGGSSDSGDTGDAQGPPSARDGNDSEESGDSGSEQSGEVEGSESEDQKDQTANSSSQSTNKDSDQSTGGTSGDSGVDDGDSDETELRNSNGSSIEDDDDQSLFGSNFSFDSDNEADPDSDSDEESSASSSMQGGAAESVNGGECNSGPNGSDSSNTRDKLVNQGAATGDPSGDSGTDSDANEGEDEETESTNEQTNDDSIEPEGCAHVGELECTECGADLSHLDSDPDDDPWATDGSEGSNHIPDLDSPTDTEGHEITRPLAVGTVDDVADALGRFLAHGNPLTGDESDGLLERISEGDLEELVGELEGKPLSERLEELLRVAIRQVLYFDTSSRFVAGVETIQWPHDRSQWLNVYRPEQFAPTEALLGQAVLRARQTFDANKRKRHIRNLRSGRINTRALGRRAPIGDDRIFQKSVLPGRRSYVVVITGDASGSTTDDQRNTKIKRAMYAQAELLTRIGVPFEMWFHSAWTQPQNKMGTGSYFDGENYYVYMYAVKLINEAWNEAAKIKLVNMVPVADNLDGHTLEFVRKRIQLTDATDKIIMYYTDGEMPAANAFEEKNILERESALCKREGITLLGVGVHTDSPKAYGMNTVRMDSDDDVIKVLQHLEHQLER